MVSGCYVIDRDCLFILLIDGSFSSVVTSVSFFLLLSYSFAKACLAGHVHIDSSAIIGGQAGVKQFVRIGYGAMIGGQSAVRGDVIPFGLVQGDPARLEGVNLVGLRRAARSREEIRTLLQAYRYLFSRADDPLPSSTFASALDLPEHATLAERGWEVLKYIHNERARQDANPSDGEVPWHRTSATSNNGGQHEKFHLVEVVVSFILERSRGLALPRSLQARKNEE